MFRTAYFDLETTDLAGDFGRILCGSILRHDGTMQTFRQDEIVAAGKARNMADDREISKLIRDALEEHHLLVGWFSKGFDIPFLNSRLVANGHRMIKQHLHIDPRWYYSGWRGVKTRNAKLKTVSEFFGYEPKQEVTSEVWVEARTGDRKAMDIVVERCESDVRILAEITARTADEGLIRNVQMYP